jgi:hypothetical protein
VIAELGVRSLSAEAQPLLDRAIEGLSDAITDGAVDDYDIFVTGVSFTPGSEAASTATGREMSSLVANIRDWANQVGANVGPYFQQEEICSGFTNNEYTEIRFPTLTLTEYHDGRLAFVAPVRIDGELFDVLDRIKELQMSDSKPIVVQTTE